ncbi:MAG: mannose-6-phosphate isomerase, class I [Ignavibacteriae bacterium]|nr:mannose-6-phosphate isomerase, class I [Ignavibacteriota bacterium]
MDLKNISPKVYKLYNSYQNYDWGTKNNNAFIPKFVGDEVEKDLPYAELWIGAHPKLSSKIKIDENYYSLERVIEVFPNEILGKYVAQKFNNKLPFLLKILSSDRALSIQTHPDKKTAEVLHAKDPINYPDDNHKPEIAIALDGLKAIVGFKSFEEIVEVLTKYSELAEAVKYDINSAIDSLTTDKQSIIIKGIYFEIMNLTETSLMKIIPKILEKIKKEKNRTKEEIVFVQQYNNFGNDIGLISILLFNYLELAKDEAIFTDAGIPHAYMKGNIIECMANSDNVVRAGLTRKHKDVETLLSILEFEKSLNEKIIPNFDFTKFIYPTPNSEFELSSNNYLNSEEQIINNNSSVKIILVTYGILIVEWIENDVIFSREFEQGEAILIPGNLKSYKLTNNNSTKFVMVEVPEAS